MDEIPNYNFLQAIDPTKIKVPISERFAKLTLSSNKKQQQKCNEPDQLEELKRQQEKRESVTRNICKQFDNETQLNEEQKLEQNPLLRSESSSKETECDNSVDEVDLTMEPLEVSCDEYNPSQTANELELLSQQMASMCVQPKPISLSSGSTANLSIFSDLISSESQRSSTNEVDNIHIVHDVPINVSEAAKRDTIHLNLTTSTTESLDKTYEMTGDEEEYSEEEEDEPITISDTSGSHREEDEDIMLTSSLPSTSARSENLSLPSLVDDKAERVAAFLRDVSIEQRAMIDQGQVIYHDTIDQILDNNEIDKIQQTLDKSRQIATADTESMTPDLDEEVTPIPLVEREKRLKVLEKVIEKEQVKRENLEIYTETEDQLCTPKSRNNTKNAHRLANDETLDNTVMTEAEMDSEIEETPKMLTRPNNSPQNAYRIANDETQCNSDYSMNVETPKIAKNNNNRNAENSRRLADLETEDNTQSFLIPKSQDQEKTLIKNSKTITNDETIKNLSISSTQSTPQSSIYSGSNYDSIASALNSTNEFNATTPEHSITILETDEDESVEQKSPTKRENSVENKLSNSFHKDESSDDSSECDGQMSQIQMSMGKINISAKINIKISIPNNISTETSEDDENNGGDSQDNEGKSNESNQLTDMPGENNEQDEEEEGEEPVDNNHSLNSNEKSKESDTPQRICHQMQSKAPAIEIVCSRNKSADFVELKEDEKFLTEAEKLLTQLYGKSWQTPDVIRSLKRTSQSGGDKKANKSKTSSIKKIDVNNSTEKKCNNKSKVEESLLGDFSMFRLNIVKTNLDSTRLATPKSVATNKEVLTEPKNRRTPPIEKGKMDAKPRPQTERKPTNARNKGRVNKEKWRQLIDDDSNSEGDNASDDEDADESWSKIASDLEVESSDSDFEISSKNKAKKEKSKNSKKRSCRSDKSDYLTKVLNRSKDDEIVYLDLSKEEVEVQNEVPESPPANHDVTFATRLQDILKSCQHEDKPKLPSSSQKTKRKLFTPNFGDDNVEIACPSPAVEKSKENAAPTKKWNCNDDEILEDKGIFPFDSQGRPKIFDLVNKQLESVKTGKPVFQTPPLRNKFNTPNSIKKSDRNAKDDIETTPKTKTDTEAIFKTPLSVKSKATTKALRDILQTPHYKYSFLKSLDVTVSKTLCHPEALYYRDNYRIKKEDLSKILYDLYNDKLFQNQLDVPIKWNKKLLNTAGRCFNKKKNGVRSSVVELSDKVLTSADRLRCTLIHEMCHAATWIYNGEGGHGNSWKEWARKANEIFPEIPEIGVCHQYDIEYKYTYKCTLCGAKSHAHSKSKKVENIRCSYCHGAIEVYLNKKDKDGNIMPTPVREPTGFAKFVKDNYKKFKNADLKHADVMKLLSSEFASLKVASN